MNKNRGWIGALCIVLIAVLSGCAYFEQERTKRDKTKKGAAIGAGAGAAAAILLGERELDEILAGAAIGAGIGAGVGAYMDHQEEKLARIPGTTVERVDDDLLLLNFESDVLFAIDSAELNQTARASLDQAAGVFQEYDKTAIIAQGHTDSTGTDSYNQDLSERRAGAVARYLIGRGVESVRITSVGYGETHPVADNESQDGRRLNRRVDILIKAKAN